MVKISFIEPINSDWIAWREKCEAETAIFINAIDRNENYTVTNLYKDKKIRKLYFFCDDFKSPFWRKCAYCEGSIANQDGDVEHFRPKKRVSNDNYEAISKHKGYYWLAYDWKNLLPSCQKCNQRRVVDKMDGKFIVGKQDRFPLENESQRVFHHLENLSIEKPLLINPMIEDPEEHLEVELRTGVVKWKSPRGKMCVDIFGLNIRDELREGRKGTIQIVRSLLNKFLTYIEDEEINKAQHSLIEILKYVKGEKQFSLAAKCFLKVALGQKYVTILEDRLVELA